MPTPDALLDLISQELAERSHSNDPDVLRLTAAIRQRLGDGIAAVLLYGSYLRGRRDTLLDFYVLLDDLSESLPRGQALGNRLLPPNIYYLSLPATADRGPVRAKYATMTLTQFERAMHDFHGYFWSRFTQPAGLVSARSATAAARIAGAVTIAVHSFVRHTLPLLPPAFTAAELWQRGFALTYASELRAEQADGVESLYRHQPARFDALLAAYERSAGAAITATGDGCYRATGPPVNPRRARIAWGGRRAAGKLLSVLRLMKAAVTFDDPLDYLLWKIERHSGIYIEPSARARRHPLVFAWPLLWRLYRRGAFR